MSRKPPPIPLVPAPPGAEELYEEGTIVSLQIRVAEKWAEMFKTSARELGMGHAAYLIDIMRFAAAHEPEFSKWWMETKKKELLEGLKAMGRSLDGLAKHAAYAEQQKKAKKAPPKKPKPRK